MNIGIWIRVSTDDQARGESPKNHEARARMYAEFKGWNVVELYDLSGTSGKAVIETPEAQRMLKDVASGKIQALIFSKLARLARNVRELLDFSEYFQKHNANLVSLEESIDTSTPAGRLLFTVIGALAQWEREEISARVSASVPIRAKLGKPTGGKGQFGYMWASVGEGESKRLVLNPKEAPTVKRIFELFLEKKKLLTTCKALNEEGLRPRKSMFRVTTLKRILTDPTYKGLRRANYSKRGGNKKAWKLKPQSEWVYHEVPPLVSPETWEAVRAIFQERTAKYQAGVPKESRYPFGGLLVCDCGKKMYVQPYEGMKINRYGCKNCKNKINEDVITEQFLEGIKAMIVTPEKLEGPKNESPIEALQERLENARRELLAVTGKIEKLLELWNEGMIDKPTFSERFDSLRDRKEQLTNEIPRIQGKIDFINVAEVGRDYLLARAVSIASMWPLFDDATKNGLIREIVDSITVGKDSLDFSFTCPPNFMPLEKDAHTRRGSGPPRA